jgi:hypothetical protein
MEKAKKTTHQATRGNRNYEKEDFIRNHKKSKVKSVVDPRLEEVNILLTHQRRACLNKTIELHQLDIMRARWERDGYTLTVIN